jgi:hypothetical protein
MFPVSRFRGRFRTKTFGAVWTPAQISTALWLDASDAGTITLNGANVSQWNDKSGNGKHATQATAAAQPDFSATGLNGKPSINFAGTTDYLNTPLIQPSGGIVAMVLSPLQRPVNNNLTPIGAATVYNGGGLYVTLQNFSTAAPTFVVYRGTAQPSSSRFYNGAPSTIPTSFVPAIFSFFLTGTTTQNMPIVIGAIQASPPSSETFYGGISEVVIASDNSLSTLQKIDGYLAWKWGGF